MKKQLLAAALSLGLLGTTLPAPISAHDDWGGKRQIQACVVDQHGWHARARRRKLCDAVTPARHLRNSASTQ